MADQNACGDQRDDLDSAFLEFLGNNPEQHRQIHGHYLAFFAGRRRVVDLACGQGHFVAALVAAGVDAFGVDDDPGCVAAAREQGLDVRHADVFEFLRAAPPGSVDGIFCAHLVEHLRYEQVLELLRLAFDALAGGGVIVLVTPNSRSLSTHLESFYLHFGHESFYDPRLLCFFLQHAGFDAPRAGENPRLAFPLWGRPPGDLSLLLDPAAYRYERVVPRPTSGGRRLLWRAKRVLAALVVQPYVDRVVEGVNTRLQELGDRERRVGAQLASLDRPVEAYAVATKSPDG